MQRQFWNLLTLVTLQLVLASNAFGQLSVEGRPLSYDLTNLTPNVEITELPALNADSILAVDAIEMAEGKGYRIGIAVQRELNLENSGTWDTLGNGGYVWRLRIEAESATFISINYDEFEIPEGATYYIYNPNDTTRYLGAFTKNNNRNGGIWATSRIRGSEVILEYFEPANSSRKGIIKISSIVHGYSGFSQNKDYGDSYACHINVSCPQADPLEDQINSVVMISRNQNQRICSGTLVNNVKLDSTPYILTSWHCLEDDIDSLGNWIFYFNYQHPLVDSISGCDSTFDADSLFLNQNIIRAMYRASNAASDNMLLQMDTLVPASFNAYYSGWSADTTTPSSTVSIHHPAGDIKKASFDVDPASESLSGIETWDVEYHPDTGTGLVEGGSSGSALFDQNKRVVGTHTTAPSTGDLCNANSQVAKFGRINYSWDQLADSSLQLKYWLDPDTTDTLFIDGFDPNESCCIDDRGDANGDGNDTNILDLNYLVNYIFRGGPPVVCTEEGNMNGDPNENIDILDLTYITNTIFRDGPLPPECP